MHSSFIVSRTCRHIARRFLPVLGSETAASSLGARVETLICDVLKSTFEMTNMIEVMFSLASQCYLPLKDESVPVAVVVFDSRPVALANAVLLRLVLFQVPLRQS